ncbi:MAG: hypothetical protein JNL70_04575 [Saprospiraceae bacterium]|nr:hypothetical protein [Saprospiraceae bacterium]
MDLPYIFEQMLRGQLGDEYPKFIGALNETPPVSIRYNNRKILNSELGTQNLELKKIPWHTEGVYLPERPSFTLDPAFHGGAYYVQEASSMFIAEALRQTVDLQEDVRAVDFCAAPGGKSTLVASLLSKNSFLIANEVIKSRVEVLKENLIKWGYPSVCATNHDVEDFAALENFFDVVLVDAPCSGEGLFRKDPKAVSEWSPDAVQTCSARQKRILAAAVKTLQPNGILLYSTCTYNDFENKENVEWLIQKFDLECVKLSVQAEWGIVEKPFGYQFYPHRVRGEGFFLSVFRKKNKGIPSLIMPKLNFEKLPKKQIEVVARWLQNPNKFDFFLKPNGVVFVILKKHIEYYALIDKVLKRKSTGLEIGEFKGNDFIPSHDLALSIEVAETTPSVNLEKMDALRFLKKETFDFDFEQTPKGWALVRYEGLALGWVKILSNRVNNYLPKDYRIRMAID